jgi:hypothetical protein
MRLLANDFQKWNSLMRVACLTAMAYTGHWERDRSSGQASHRTKPIKHLIGGFRPACKTRVRTQAKGGAPDSIERTAKVSLTSQPFTHTTCFSVCTTSTRSLCAAITALMSL